MTLETTFADDVALALHYAPADLRGSMSASFALDHQLARIVNAAREPQLAMIRLAWWRDQLAELDEAPRPVDPILADCQNAVHTAGISSQRLSDIAEGWMIRLQPDADTPGQVQEYARLRGKSLFDAIGQAEGMVDTGAAGIAFVLADLARQPDQRQSRRADIAALLPPLEVAFSRRLRPLALLEAWARRDLARLAAGRSPLGLRARAWSALWFARHMR